jgi:ATP-dependent DNA ligase
MITIKPMLAIQGKAFSDKDWIFEPKIDGARCIAHISDRTAKLQNRRLKSITYHYPEVVRSLRQNAGDCILDGEMAVFKNGVPDFHLFQFENIKSIAIRSIVFRMLCPQATLSLILFIRARKA